MKLVTVIISPSSSTTSAKPFPPPAFTASPLRKSRASAVSAAIRSFYRGAEYVVDFLPKIRIDIAVTDDAVDTVIEAVLASARTGKVGDGKIFVSLLEHVVRIRTGEEDEGAI